MCSAYRGLVGDRARLSHRAPYFDYLNFEAFQSFLVPSRYRFIHSPNLIVSFFSRSFLLAAVGIPTVRQQLVSFDSK